MLSGFVDLEQEFSGLVHSSRGRGLHLAFDMKDGQSRDYVVKTAFDNGLLIGGSGSKSVRMRPALNFDKEEAYKVLDTLRQVMKTM